MKNGNAFVRIESHAKCLQRLRIVKYIRSNAWFKRYQADNAELDSRITHNHAYSYLLTIVDHFSKYGFVYAIPDKKAETIRNYMAQVFVIGDLKCFIQTMKKNLLTSF